MKATPLKPHEAESDTLLSDRDRLSGCFFCGTKPLTKEHILPDWIGRAIPEWNTSSIMKHVPSTDGAHEFKVKSFNRSLLRNTVKATCASCNNGWMSHLESRIMHHLGRLLLGDAVLLAGPACDDFIRWSIKTHMMRTQWDPAGAPFPEAHRLAIKDGARIPPGWSLRVGRSPVFDAYHRNWSATFRASDRPMHMVSHTTLTLGSFILSVAYVSDSEWEPRFLEFADSASPANMVTIRPSVRPQIILAPPPIALSVDECNQLSDHARQWAAQTLGVETPRLQYLPGSNAAWLPPRNV